MSVASAVGLRSGSGAERAGRVLASIESPDRVLPLAVPPLDRDALSELVGSPVGPYTAGRVRERVGSALSIR